MMHFGAGDPYPDPEELTDAYMFGLATGPVVQGANYLAKLPMTRLANRASCSNKPPLQMISPKEISPEKLARIAKRQQASSGIHTDDDPGLRELLTEIEKNFPGVKIVANRDTRKFGIPGEVDLDTPWAYIEVKAIGRNEKIVQQIQNYKKIRDFDMQQGIPYKPIFVYWKNLPGPSGDPIGGYFRVGKARDAIRAGATFATNDKEKVIYMLKFLQKLEGK